MIINMKFPKDFCDISDRSFGWVYINKPDFVDHTLNEMQNPTGLFKKWFDYCKARVKKTTENKKDELITGIIASNRIKTFCR